MTNDQIIDDLLRREGGYVNDPADPGGATNFGITQKTLDEWLKAHGRATFSVALLSVAEARAIYMQTYIVDPGFLHVDDDCLRWLLVDSGVNNGRERTIRWLQTIVGTAVDGAFGPQTLARLAAMPVAVVYYRLCQTRIVAYADLIAQNHVLVKYVAGWMRRAGFFVSARPA